MSNYKAKLTFWCFLCGIWFLVDSSIVADVSEYNNNDIRGKSEKCCYGILSFTNLQTFGGMSKEDHPFFSALHWINCILDTFSWIRSKTFKEEEIFTYNLPKLDN